MPLIEYRCSQCAHVFERLVTHLERDNGAVCPECGQKTGKRLISLFAQIRADDGQLMPTGGGSGGGCCGAAGCACGR